MGSNATDHRPPVKSKNERKPMRDILLLATLVATVTYAAGFSPPGGVWQDTAGHLPGDPIFRSTNYMRYLIFFYCNATACASSLMVVVLILVLIFVRRDDDLISNMVIPLLVLMLVCLISLVVAYAAGIFQDVFTVVYAVLAVAAIFGYVATHAIRRWRSSKDETRRVPESDERKWPRRWPRELLLQLGTFALTVTYVGGLTLPGGFWDSAKGGNRPGDAILKGARLTAFIYLNTTAFVASLLVVMALLAIKRGHTRAALLGSVLMLLCLLGSYLAGCCRETDTTVYLTVLIVGILAFMLLFQVLVTVVKRRKGCSDDRWWRILKMYISRLDDDATMQAENSREPRRDYYSISTSLQLIATLAVTITYQAGLHPPGGVWEDNRDGHKAGDPILQTTSPSRYHAFFYCNSVAFVASMASMALVQRRLLLKHRALEQAMIVYLLGLVGAYAFGSCRDATTTVYTMGLGGAALVYVVLHVVFLEGTCSHHRRGDKSDGDDVSLDIMGYGLFLFAIFVATTTYQAGLTPPGGFLLKGDESGHHAGDPVLLYNYPRRYSVFFFCNSTSFMASVAVIILLVNPNMYRPAIRTLALPFCSSVTFFCLLAAFAAGTTQHLKTSIYTLVLEAVVFFISALLLLVVILRPAILPIPAPAVDPDQAIDPIAVTSGEEGQACATTTTAAASIADDDDQGIDHFTVTTSEQDDQARTSSAPARTADDESHPIGPKSRQSRANQRYQMTVGILLASVTYQAGLDPPGGAWQGSSDGHHAGYPVMQDNRRQRYMAFFYSNSTSFIASILLMLQLLMFHFLKMSMQHRTWIMSIKTTLFLDFLGLLGAYTAGSTRQCKSSVIVVAIFLFVLAYFCVHVVLSLLTQKQNRAENQPQQPHSIEI